MATASAQLPEQQPTIAQVSDRTRKPEGVVSRRAQQYLIMGMAVVIVLVAMFSSKRQSKPISAAQIGPGASHPRRQRAEGGGLRRTAR